VRKLAIAVMRDKHDAILRTHAKGVHCVPHTPREQAR